MSGPVTSPFGYRWGRLHAGIDIAVPVGTPIHAAASGTVALAGWVDGYGNYTCIDHGGGLATCYAHQSSLAVSVGEHVTQGQVIGYSGNTGHSTGPISISKSGSTAPPSILSAICRRSAGEAEGLREQEDVQARNHRRDDDGSRDRRAAVDQDAHQSRRLVKMTSGISAKGIPNDRTTWLMTRVPVMLCVNAITTNAGAIVTARRTNSGSAAG